MLTPRPYQQIGIDFLSAKKRAILGDAPGLGKTLQAAIAVHPPVLVVAPTYLTTQWADFISQQFPLDSVALANGTQLSRLRALSACAKWTIVNTEMLRTYDMPRHTTSVIFDEAHHLRGRTAQQAKAAVEVARFKEQVFLLTATPIIRECDDLYMLLRIINPYKFKSYWGFVQQFCKIDRTPWADKVVGCVNPEALSNLLSQYMIQRSYKEVGMQLPAMIEQLVRIKFKPDRLSEYQNVKNEYRYLNITLDSAIQVLQVLRHLTICREKIDTTVSLIQDINVPTVIYTWYKESARILAMELKADLVTGDMTPNERVKVARNSKLVVATIASMSEGVDLSHMRAVVFFEEDWTPGVMYQALSRVRRHSQNPETVLVYYITMHGSVDESIHKMITRRVSSTKEILKEALL